jgi:hypothetical protein
MLRAVLLIVFAIGLLAWTVLSEDMRAVMSLAGIAGTCMALNWLTSKERS